MKKYRNYIKLQYKKMYNQKRKKKINLLKIKIKKIKQNIFNNNMKEKKKN